MKRQKKFLTLSLCAALCASAGVAGVAFNAVEADAATEYKTANTTTAFTFEEGASIRVSDPTGIRFTATVAATANDTTLYTVADDVVTISEDVEIGMIVVPAQALAGVENYDVFDYLAKKYNKTTNISTVFEADQFVKNDDGEYCVKGAIVKLLNANYSYAYQAIAYYKTGASTEETTDDKYYYSAKSDSRTIAYVADAALNDTTKTWSTENIAKFKKIISDTFTYANGESYKAELVVDNTLDLTTVLPVVEGTSVYTYSVPDGNGVATVSGNVLTAVAPGETTVMVTAYGGALLTIPVKVTYQQVNVETEVDAGLDLAKAINGTVATVTLNGEEVAHTNGVVALEKTDAAKDAKAYIVTDTEGNNYQVNAKIWSLFIDDAEELLKANTYTWNEQYAANAAGDLNYKVWGYFKLTDDIDMGTQTWARSNAIATEVSTTFASGGFLGVFDGNGKVINNFTTIAHEKAGLISYTGETAEVKNLTFTNAQQKSYATSAILVHSACGGLFENIVIELKAMPLAWDIANAGGALFGTIYYNIDKPVKLKDIKIVNCGSTTYGTGTYHKSTALGYMTISAPTKLVLDGVTIIGFNDYLMSADNAYFIGENSLLSKDKTTTDNTKSIYDYATIQGSGLKVFDDNKEYLNSAIQLPAQELELDATKAYTVTVDFAAMVSGTVKKVTIDDVAIEGTSKTFGKTDASNVAKVCLIEMKDGTLYKVNITVWSMLIDSEDELMQATNYTYSTEYYDKEKLTDYTVYGYFKLMTDLKMDGKTWTTENCIAKDAKSTYAGAGFQGVFDGNGKTIENFTISQKATGLIERIGKNGIVKDLTFKNASITATTECGVLSYYICGGTYSNITIEVTDIPKGTAINNAPGVLFGKIYHYANTVTLTNIKILNFNKTSESAYGTGSTDYATALGNVPYMSKNKIVLNGVTIVGFNDYLMSFFTTSATNANTKYVGETSSWTADKQTVTQNDGIANYETIGTNGLNVYTIEEWEKLQAN